MSQHIAPSILMAGELEVGVLMLQVNGMLLRELSPSARGNSVLAIAAVRQNGLALAYASEELRADYDVVREAVQQHGCALQFAAPSLRADVTLVQLAVQQNGEALESASELLRRCFAPVYAAVLSSSLSERRCMRTDLLCSSRRPAVVLTGGSFTQPCGSMVLLSSTPTPVCSVISR